MTSRVPRHAATTPSIPGAAAMAQCLTVEGESKSGVGEPCYGDAAGGGRDRACAGAPAWRPPAESFDVGATEQ